MDVTIIARVVDGLPLAASIQETEQIGQANINYQRQTKQILKQLSMSSPQKFSIESGPYVFHNIILENVCFMTLCDLNFNKKLAYSFLQDISKEFYNQYGNKIDTCKRPYPFIEFDIYIQKIKKRYIGNQGKEKISSLLSELCDVENIMLGNIDLVLKRGIPLSALDKKSNILLTESAQYRKNAKSLNRTTWISIKVGLSVLVILFILFYFVY